jgi:Uma2 family endonuclease
MEIVSPDDPRRDYVDKRADYAAAGVPEYWIIDPARRAVTVLVLAGSAYVAHEEAVTTGVVPSPTVPGLVLDVEALFAAGTPPA